MGKHLPRILSGLKAKCFLLNSYYYFEVSEDDDLYDYVRENHKTISLKMSDGFRSTWKQISNQKQYSHLDICLDLKETDLGEFEDEKRELSPYYDVESGEYDYKFSAIIRIDKFSGVIAINGDQEEMELIDKMHQDFAKLSLEVMEKVFHDLEEEIKDEFDEDDDIELMPSFHPSYSWYPRECDGDYDCIFYGYDASEAIYGGSVA